MSSTSTYAADKDTYFREEQATTNNGTAVQLWAGEGSGGGKIRNTVLEFDVSNLVGRDVVSATLSLTNKTTLGAGTKSLTVARLDQSFTEAGATWNTYDGATAWPGGGGAGGDADTGLTTTTVLVGSGSSDPEIDITNLVVDAITRRGGVLRIVIYVASGDGVQSVSKWGSSRHTTPGDRPSLAVVVADVIAWDGSAGDGDASNRSNWAGGNEPTATDIAVIAEGPSITTGSITCHRLQIGRRYTGEIGAWTTAGVTPDTAISVTAGEVVAASVKSKWHLNLSGGTALRIMDTPSGDRVCSAQGTYDAYVSRTRGELWLLGATLGDVDAHGRGSIRVTDTSTIRTTGFRAVLTAGASSVTAGDRSSIRLDSTAVTDTTLTVASGSRVTCLAGDVGSVAVYDGRIRWRGNTGAPITCGAIVVYPSGLIDTRTESATFSHDTGAITNYAGRVLTDAAMEGAVT